MLKKSNMSFRFLAASIVLTALTACDSTGILDVGAPSISLPVKLIEYSQSDSDCYLRFRIDNTSSYDIVHIYFDVTALDKNDDFVAEGKWHTGIRNTPSGKHYVDKPILFEGTSCRDISNLRFNFTGGQISNASGGRRFLKNADLVLVM